MTENRPVRCITGKNGQIELWEDHVVILRPDNKGNYKIDEAFPLLMLSSIQCKGGGLFSSDGYIHFTLLGQREVDNSVEASKNKFGIIFDVKQRGEFSDFKQEAEKRMSGMRETLSNHPEILQVEAKVSNQVETRSNQVRLERILESIDEGIEDAIEAWKEHEKEQTERDKHQLSISNEQHRRGIYLLAGIIAAVFVMSVIALLKGQFELVKWILSSSFAAGAGATLKEALTRKGRKE